jgi:hypothetical protein
LWRRIGERLDEEFEFAADFELWARFYEHSDLYGVCVPIAGSRIHENPRNSHAGYFSECSRVLARYRRGGHNAWLRSVLRVFRLHEIPKVRIAMSNLLGYELLSIRGISNGSETSWKVYGDKKLI